MCRFEPLASHECPGGWERNGLCWKWETWLGHCAMLKVTVTQLTVFRLKLTQIDRVDDWIINSNTEHLFTKRIVWRQWNILFSEDSRNKQKKNHMGFFKRMTGLCTVRSSPAQQFVMVPWAPACMEWQTPLLLITPQTWMPQIMPTHCIPYLRRRIISGGQINVLYWTRARRSS